MAILNDSPDCARCLGCGTLERCPLCGSDDIGDTGPDGCEHELAAGQSYEEIDCPECDRTGDAEAEEDADETDDEE